MGDVYAARDTELDRVVALKFVTGDSPQADAGLRREARRASQLNHPNVCTIHQVGAAEGTTFFVMEYVAGQTLGAAIGPGGLPLDALVNYASQIAAAVGHAHDCGLLHRDLKSANVILTPEGRIKVLDFGLAVPIGRRASELSQSHTSLAADEPVAGTLPYMAPELLLAKPPDPRSDIWAFGVLLYEMAVGRRPFVGTTGFELCAAILSREPAPLPDRVPDALRALIARTLLKDPGERCASIAEVAAALDGLRVPTGAASAGLAGARLVASRLPGSLPSSRTSFVGRVEELLRFEHELEAAGMVTLTGVGGSGKTRLALRMAEQARPRFPGGVWWVDLAPLSDGARVDEAVATVFGVLNAQRSPRDAMLEWLAGRRLLLVLDNCEHVVSAVSDLADAILAASEDVRILATSREGLGLPGERIVAVPSLSTPPADGRRRHYRARPVGRGAPLRRACRWRASRLRPDRGQRSRDSRRLPPSRRYTARHRARRGACPSSQRRADSRASQRSSHAPVGTDARRGTASDARGDAPVELRPPHSRRAAGAAAAVGVPGRMGAPSPLP